ncbi:MAG: hypothetical protein QM723_13150 [Myxococcaceae bacterium]
MRLSISAKHFTVPEMCVCCGETADVLRAAVATRVTGKRVHHIHQKSFNFPYCARCVHHLDHWPTEPFWGPWLAIFCTLGFWMPRHLKAAAARERAALDLLLPSCVCNRQPPVRLVGWNGTITTFDLDSNKFAYAFMRANSKKLLDIEPWLHRELAGSDTPPQDPRWLARVHRYDRSLAAPVILAAVTWLVVAWFVLAPPSTPAPGRTTTKPPVATATANTGAAVKPRTTVKVTRACALRATGDTAGAVVGDVATTDAPTLLETQQNWVKVKKGKVEAWVSRGCVDLNAAK